MRSILFWFLIGLIGLPLLLYAISLDDSFVVWVFGNTTVEMPLWFTIAALLLTMYTISLVFRLLKSLVKAPDTFASWMGKRKRKQAQSLTLQGLLLQLEGHFDKAQHAQTKAIPKSAAPALNHLLAAQAFISAKDLSSAEEHIRTASGLLPDAKIPLGIFHAKMLQQVGVFEKAHYIIQTLAAENPNHAYLQEQLVQSYQLRGEKDRALALLAEKQAKKQLKDSDEIAQYARLLIDNQRDDDAEALLRRHLNTHWHRDWVACYGEAAASDGAAQLAHAEKWLLKHPEEPVLHLALARICQRQKLWAKARDYYESYLARERDETAANDLVQLLQALGEQERANVWRQRIAAHHKQTLPLPALPAA